MTNPAIRLLTAVGVSAGIHLSLLSGISVRLPVADLPQPFLSVRLNLEQVRTAEAAPSAPVSTVVQTPAFRPLEQTKPPAVAPAIANRAAVDQPIVVAGGIPPAETEAPLPVVEMPMVADPTYYPAKHLDVYPQALDTVAPEYPRAAAVARITGEVTVVLSIDETGRVNEASVAAAQPEGYFEEAALATFSEARFSPAQRHGRPVRSRILVKLSFNDPQQLADAP